MMPDTILIVRKTYSRVRVITMQYGWPDNHPKRRSRQHSYVDAAVGKPSDLYDEAIAIEAIEKSKGVLNWILNNLKIS